jgi:hypothetical protein
MDNFYSTKQYQNKIKQQYQNLKKKAKKHLQTITKTKKNYKQED